MVGDLEDPRRSEPAGLLGERAMLEAWLEYHRVTLLLKCEGLDPEQLRRRPVPTSALSLHGLVRHMTEVERVWFLVCLHGEADAARPYFDPAVPDSELIPLHDADWEADRARYEAECESSRRIAAAHAMDDAGTRRGEPHSLRWIYVHMVEEYARHNGHADLIRELIDGAVGW
jgi:hypothetical protein